MNTGAFVTPEYIIRECSERMRDTAFNHGLSRGWYTSQIRNIMNKLDMGSFMNLKTVDLPVPTNFQIPYPDDAFNIREVYLWNGSCCNIAFATRMYWKTEFNNMPNGQGYTAARMDDLNGSSGNDPYAASYGWWWVTNQNAFPAGYLWAYYFNISQGVIMISQNSSFYQNIRLVYNNISTPFGQTPCIPLIFEEVVKCWVCREFCSVLLLEEKKYAPAYEMYHAQLYDRATGMWWESLDRVKQLHSVQRESLGITLTGAGNY